MNCFSISTTVPICPLIHSIFRAKFDFQSQYHHYSIRRSSVSKLACSQNTTPQQQEQQLNLSVLRFTLGIPGLDESYLPRYIGYAFGALLLLNHFVGSSSSSSIAPAQLVNQLKPINFLYFVSLLLLLNFRINSWMRTEALGLSLAVFSAVVPYLGKFLKGNAPTQQNSVPEGVEQIFVMSRDIEDTLKEDLAWGSYVLLRNTNSISVLISVEDGLCVRGYWNTPKDMNKDDIADWFGEKIEKIKVSFSDLNDSVYFDLTRADSELREMAPEGIMSLLLQPIGKEKKSGFILLASSIDYAYTAKDKAWISAIANKF